MNKLKKYTFSIIFILGITFAPILVSTGVSAQEPEANISGALACGADLNFSPPPEGCSTDPEGISQQVDEIVSSIINILSLIVGVVAVIMIIIGGLRYITSGGDSGNVTSAKNTILYAVVGLIVVALAQVVVKFVVNRTAPLSTGSSTTTVD